MIRVYENLNLGIYFGILGLFWGLFSDFLVFSLSDFGTFFGTLGHLFVFCDFLGGIFGGFLDILFGIFVRVYEDFLSCEPLGRSFSNLQSPSQKIRPKVLSDCAINT